MPRTRPVAEPLIVFCASLREVRRVAGQPTLAVLGAAMPRKPSVSTLSDLLNARITTAPAWGVVAEFVSACAAVAGTTIDLASWRRRHADLERELDAIRRHKPGAPQALATATTLPHDIATFTGREHELARLAEALLSAGAAGPVAIVAIDGMPGVGKTSLAVRAAHQMTSQFSNGQLFVDLHAHTAGQSPVSPADALHALLLALGVEPGAIPEHLDERAALWRNKCAGKKLLILLDDVVGHDQVKPLLPGAPGAAVLITGRRRLAALDGAVMMPLDILTPAEAAELFVRTSGTGDPRSAAVRDLTEKVGNLPLAIRLLAGRLRSHPAWTVVDLIAELDAANDRSAAIRAENIVVGAVFDLSFNALPEQVKPLFRAIGLHPGVDFDVLATAALAGVDEETARQGLDVLYEDHLVEETIRGRYRLHDLLRDYARSLAPARNSEEAHAAMSRLLTAYRTAAKDADDLLRGVRDKTLASRAEGRARLDLELPNLVAAIEQTADDHGASAARLSHVLYRYLHLYGRWRDAAALYRTASRAARLAGDRGAEANALRDLGTFYGLLGRSKDAEPLLRQALSLHESVGNRAGRADTLGNLATVLRRRGHYQEAIERAGEALDLFRELGYRRRVSAALGEISILRTFLGDYYEARQNALAALLVCRGLDDPIREASTLRILALAEVNLEMYNAAEEHLVNALQLAREIDYRFGVANALDALGVVESRRGRFDEAQALYGQALSIFVDLGDTRGLSLTLNNLGKLLCGRDPRAARRYHVLALRVAHTSKDVPCLAAAWDGIGRALVVDGDTQGGLRRLRRALALYRDVWNHDSDKLDAFVADVEGRAQNESTRGTVGDHG